MPHMVETGPADGDLLLLTTVEGVAARLGHALTLRVDRWSCSATVDGDIPTSMTFTADLSSLVVLEGRGGLKPLSNDDKRAIARNARATLKVDRHPSLTFTMTSIEGTYVVRGTCDLHGATQSLDVDVTVEGDVVRAITKVRQSSFGIAPYSQLLGSLRVGDDVSVGLAVRLAKTAGADVPRPASG